MVSSRYRPLVRTLVAFGEELIEGLVGIGVEGGFPRAPPFPVAVAL